MEEYFRRSVFIPFLDHFKEELHSRFLQHGELLSKIQGILPMQCIYLCEDNLLKTVQALEREWPNDVALSADDFVAELRMWRRRCSRFSGDEMPKTFIDSLNSSGETLYPSLHKFLMIGAILPISVATTERSFSTLRLLKSYLRNKTVEERLDGLTFTPHTL